MSPPSSPSALVGGILMAVRSCHQGRVQELLDEAAATYGIDAALDEVVFPALRTVGMFWSSGTVDVAHEHLLSVAVARWVSAQTAAQPCHRKGVILLAAVPQELHTLGLACLELLLTTRGVIAVNIGSNASASLLLAARSLQPQAIVLTAHNPTLASSAARTARAITDAGYPVYYAGAAFASQFVRSQAGGTPLDDTLAATADLLTRRHTVSGHIPHPNQPVAPAVALTA